MKNIIKNIDKSNLIFTLIYKEAIYICWYLFAIAFVFFLKESITDKKVLLLAISVLVIYIIRNFFKYLYRKISYNTYHEIKHNIEISYFEKLNKISNKEIEKMDMEKVSGNILNFSFHITKIVSDVIETVIPCLIGLIVFYVVLIPINFLVSLISILIIGFVIHQNYRTSNKISCTNYNDLLEDFVKKIITIKRLNIFKYCKNKLDKNNDNDICILKETNTSSDLIYSNGIFIVLALVLITVFFTVPNTTTKLGLIIFFAIIVIKLQDLLYNLSLSFKNIQEVVSLKEELDKTFVNYEVLKYAPKWKKIHVKDGVYKYESGVQIKIPDFELIKGDQISIMGKSGQGKSTILNVLSGYDSLSSGSIFFDGKGENKIVDAVYLSKNIKMFKVSLRDNLLLGANYKDEDIINLIKEIGLLNWYSNLSDGLDTLIDDKNVVISLDIQERLNLIRGIIMDKELYFLDEPTLSLDIESEKLVANMIKKYFKKKTFIIITSRPILTTICKKHYFIKDHTLLEKEPLL